MRSEPLAFEAFRIHDAMRAPGKGTLDPITVLLRDTGSGGQIIVECYGTAWSHWFGAIGNETLRGFIADTSSDYLAGKLVCSTTRRTTKHEEAYVNDIARAVISAMKKVP